MPKTIPRLSFTAVRILKEHVIEKAGTLQQREAEHLTSSTTSSTEESIFIHVSQLNQTQREQLLKCFQLTHFIVARNLLFKI